MVNIPVLLLHLQEIQDFRKKRGQRYSLYNILCISILAVFSGADDFEAMAAFTKEKEEFLQKHQLISEKRCPSHDLFRWYYQSLDVKAFGNLLNAWIMSVWDSDLVKDNLKNHCKVAPKQIHIDGKSLRATRTSAHSRTALQVVSAYYSEGYVSVGQLLVDKKSCEKTAIPQLLELLDLRDCIITIDAIATFKKNAATIVGKGGDYILALKKNNKLFYNEVDDFFTHFEDTCLIVDTDQTLDKAHGRTEKRTCRIISDLKYFSDAELWDGLQCIVCIESQRTIGEKTSIEKRYYLSSLKPHATHLMQSIRRHWTVENHLHWTLDVAFNEGVQ